LHANLRYKIDARGLDYDEKFYWIFRSSKEILKEYKQCFDIDESRECDQATLLEYRKQSTKGFPITNFTFSNSKEKDLFDQLYAKAFSLESIICQKYDDFECTFTAARTLRIGLTFSFSGNYYGKQIAYKDTNTANLFRIKREMISHKLKKSNKLRNNQYFLVSGFVTLIQRGCINCRNCIWFNTDSSYSKWKLNANIAKRRFQSIIVSLVNLMVMQKAMQGVMEEVKQIVKQEVKTISYCIDE
jgi:hypothetical protein